MAALAYRVIPKEAENQIFRHNWIFRQTCVYKQPTLTKWWNYNFVQLLYSCLRYIGRLFLDFLSFCCCNIITALWETKIKKYKDWVIKESTYKNLCEGHHFFYCTPSFLCHFLFPSSSTTLPKWCAYWMATIKTHIVMGFILYDVENMRVASLRT